MEFGLVEGKCVVFHKEPHCVRFKELKPREFMVQATKRSLEDTELLISSRGYN